ncbi:magnesium chelatase subunit H [Rhodoferax lacus]|uniref:magnesium chelatase n=1 Tax=Rhodoferax lacus TaxID=2184758 RepID=A0A3E1RCU9_9BURK|nr:magnesium chelatase subunit H [Rhodoferax lacus]RFO97051.1 magnesium chelatase subunit H [Rhodoferax lacus]
MPKPTSAAKPAGITMRVVLITMDTHLASAAQRSSSALQQQLPGLLFSTHSASEYRANTQALSRCVADIARADIVIVSMLFMEDHFLPVMEALKARRELCDAMVCIMSAPQVMQLTRMGKFTMGGQSGGLMGLLKKLRPSAKTSGEGTAPAASAGAKQMAMLRRLPKLLRFIPGTAQDVRIFFLVMRYWLAGSEHNITNMVQLVVGRYAAGSREALKKLSQAQDPVEYPEVGLYHPRVNGRITEQLADLPKAKAQQATVGLLLMRSYLLAGNATHYDTVIQTLEARGLRVIPAFASGLDARPAIAQYFMQDGRSTIDALVSLTGFSLVGGPAYNDAQAAEVVLSQLDVPYIAAHPVEFQSIAEWASSERGLLPVESTIMVAIPELDGSTVPMVYGGRPGAPGTSCSGCARACAFTEAHQSQEMFACSERIDMLSDRVERLVRLRNKPRLERKVALVLFNFPPNAGNIGTAAYLGVFESAFNTLKTLANEGYRVELPESADDLRLALLDGNREQYGAEANVHHLIPVAQHVQQETYLHEIEAQWGPAPGKHLTNGSGLFIQGVQFGQVLVCIQPGFGYEGDPMRLLFESGFAPTHAFSAFYRYLRSEFDADAVLHFGTHGALEFMPGKQTGLSARCWPDRLIGAMPNIYLYASNNPSEGALAKRRGSATLVSYLPPTLAESGLYKGLVELKQTLERWRGLDAVASEERNELAVMIHEQALALDLKAPAAIAAEAALAEPWIDALQAQLLELEYALIPDGLHVLGQLPTRAQRLTTLHAMAQAMGLDKCCHLQPLLEQLVDGASVDALARLAPGLSATQREALHQLVRSNALLQEDHEMMGLLRALDARYTLPAPGGDLLRNPEVLPTGRNLHGLDPFKLPTTFAVRDGQRQAEKLIARFAADGGTYPESVAMVLWGTDNLKTEGSPMAQALALMGVLPRFDSYGRLAGATLIPLAELGRPRIDVVITLSGIFRDLLPMQIKLLAEASFMAASADEPGEQNFIRKHALAYMAEHGGDIEAASLRVFGNNEGAYGSNVNMLVESSAWDNEDELGNTFTARKGFAYGREGRPVRNNTLLKSALANVSLTYQNVDSVELGVTSIDTYFDTLGGISRAVLQAKHDRDGDAACAPPVYVGDQTQGDGVVRTLTEQVALETRTRMLNPKWHESMLQHGYEGVRQIEAHLTNTMGWSATTGQVQPWVYQQLAQTFMLDPAMRERLATLNPTSSAKLVNRLLEASRRQYWAPDADTMKALQAAGEELEDRLEGIFEGVPA